LVLIYVPIVRRAGVLFGAAVLLLAFGLRFPDLALLGAQASVLGLVFVCLAGWLRIMLGRRQRRTRILRSGGSSVVDRVDSTDTRFPASASAGSSASTKVAPTPPSESRT
jgi:hypothetical protein